VKALQHGLRHGWGRGIEPVRLTIERLRTLVLVTAGVLIVALVGTLALSKWKSRLILNEIPKKLGANIQQEANGVTYTQARGGHTLFKIHAGKVVQLKEGDKALLHDVQIELYGADGSRVDHIAGGEFEYDQKAGTATAAGPVEITLMKPGVAPAVAPKATAGQAVKGTALENAEQMAAAGQIEVKTSGLTFNQKTGTATTEQRVEFALAQGSGSATGATFDSDRGHMVLNHDVEMTVERGAEDVKIRARHAEFERGSLIGTMTNAEAQYRGGQATAGDAKMLFREDGSAVRLDAHNGFTMTSANGTHVSAPQGWLEFDEKNHPQRGHLEGGVTLDSVTGGKQSHGSAPLADLEFSELGDLRHAHMERGVVMHSEEDAAGAHVSRDWRSPVADMAFRAGEKGKTELASVYGQGGVTMTGQTRRGDGGMTPSRMSADQVTAEFGAGQQLKHVTGTGHANVAETTATGTAQTTTGDRLEANFVQGAKAAQKPESKPAQVQGAGIAGGQIESATVDGNVTMTQQPAAKPGQAPQPMLRATAAHAVYEGAWLHLTGNPRVVNGGLTVTADKLDVVQGAGSANKVTDYESVGRTQQAGNASGDAFAHGNVKATWVNDGRDKNTSGSANGANSGTVGLGGKTPAHVIASEAEFRQATGEATFKGQQARLWQDANSVAAPVIVLDRNKRTLAAHGAGAADPVKLVMLSASGGLDSKSSGQQKTDAGKQKDPSVVRVRGGDLLYTDTTRKAVLHAVPGGTVTAETGTATSNSDVVELMLLPEGSHAANGAQVERLTAHGNVVLDSQGRHGVGEQLVYTGETGQYVLTGTAQKPPQMSDAERGTVTGNALIFNSRDDSVSIEGSGGKTTTVTQMPAKSK
jgi:lipopolysaccharide export system protein LptA